MEEGLNSSFGCFSRTIRFRRFGLKSQSMQLFNRSGVTVPVQLRARCQSLGHFNTLLKKV